MRLRIVRITTLNVMRLLCVDDPSVAAAGRGVSVVVLMAWRRVMVIILSSTVYQPVRRAIFRVLEQHLKYQAHILFQSFRKHSEFHDREVLPIAETINTASNCERLHNARM